MKKINWGKTTKEIPAIALGCMRMRHVPFTQAVDLVDTALAEDINFFDHADIYGSTRHQCEEIFGNVIKEMKLNREDIFIQSKCGIVCDVMYDFSKEHILKSVDESLKALGTDYLDSFLLHRPDALMEPEEIAEAFDELEKAGKVRHFGVSNHTPLQMELLKKSVKQPLSTNQLQFGLAHAGMVRSGIEANMITNGAVDRDGGMLDYCRLNDVTIQVWSPFYYGLFEGMFLGDEKYPELNAKLDELAAKYDVTSSAIADAWILRHPANMQVLAGTMNPEHLKELSKAADIRLTREEWYALYLSAGNMLP